MCRVLGAPRSTVYARRQPTVSARSGPATAIGDQDLVQLIRLVLRASPFAGKGYRKVRARLRREPGIRVSGKRVLRLLRREGLLAPRRVRGRRKPRPHDGTIIPDGPNQRWGRDAAIAWTRTDGWVCGCSPAWITSPPRPGPMWPRSATASPPCSRSSDPLLPEAHRPLLRGIDRLAVLVPLGPWSPHFSTAGTALLVGLRSHLQRYRGGQALEAIADSVSAPGRLRIVPSPSWSLPADHMIMRARSAAAAPRAPNSSSMVRRDTVRGMSLY
jgi:hypothetical protein